MHEQYNYIKLYDMVLHYQERTAADLYARKHPFTRQPKGSCSILLLLRGPDEAERTDKAWMETNNNNRSAKAVCVLYSVLVGSRSLPHRGRPSSCRLSQLAVGPNAPLL